MQWLKWCLLNSQITHFVPLETFLLHLVFCFCQWCLFFIVLFLFPDRVWNQTQTQAGSNSLCYMTCLKPVILLPIPSKHWEGQVMINSMLDIVHVTCLSELPYLSLWINALSRWAGGLFTVQWNTSRFGFMGFFLFCFWFLRFFFVCCFVVLLIFEAGLHIDHSDPPPIRTDEWPIFCLYLQRDGITGEYYYVVRMRNGHKNLRHLNTWPPVGGTVWRFLWGAALMKKVCHWRQGWGPWELFTVNKPYLPAVFVPAWCSRNWGCEQLSSSCHASTLLWTTAKTKASFLTLPSITATQN